MGQASPHPRRRPPAAQAAAAELMGPPPPVRTPARLLVRRGVVPGLGGSVPRDCSSRDRTEEHAMGPTSGHFPGPGGGQNAPRPHLSVLRTRPPCWRGEGSWSACRRGSETAQPDPPSEDAVWAPRPHPRKPPCAEPALPMLTSLGGGERGWHRADQGWDRALQGQLVAVGVSPASLPRPTLTG